MAIPIADKWVYECRHIQVLQVQVVGLSHLARTELHTRGGLWRESRNAR